LNGFETSPDARKRGCAAQEGQLAKIGRADGAAADRQTDRLGHLAKRQPGRLAMRFDRGFQDIGVPIGQVGQQS